MSAFQDTTLLAPARCPPGQNGQLKSLWNAPRTLRKSSSLAALYDAARHPTRTVEGVRDAVEGWYDGLTKEEREQRALQDARKRVLYLQQRSATTLAEWEAASMELDKLENNNGWKQEFSSPDYDPWELRAQLNKLEDARISGDVKLMLDLIRTTLSRNTAQMGNLKLYQYSHVGTKELVERYIETTLDTIHAVVEASDKSAVHAVDMKEIYNNLLAARQSFGRSALLLSGGGTFGMNHIGVLKALWEVKLLPRIISGASAGSIVAAVMCTTADDEIPELLRNFANGDLSVFHASDEEDSLLRKLARVLTVGSMFDIAHLKKVLRGLLGNLTFLEAYNRTRRILNICVSSSSVYELPKLLNYVTSPHVVIWSAVAASCSVPLVFSPASLLVKDPKTQEIGEWNGNLAPQKWIDGSVENDIPMQRLSEMFNVNHFIVSQVNPHVVPFLIKERDINLDEDEGRNVAPSPSWLQGLSKFARSEAIHRMTTLAEAGFMPNILTKTASVLSQTYSGDITILPEVSYADFPKVLSNPTPEFIRDAMRRGEQATWPKLSRIRNHCAIELALDNAANEVRARAVFSKAQEAARRQAFKRTRSDDGAGRKLQMLTPGPRLRKKSLTSEPGADVLEMANTGSVSQPTHHKAHSTQLSELLARATLSPLLASQDPSEISSPRIQPSDASSSAAGLTSDASDGEDSSSSSLSSGEETCIGEAMLPTPDDQITPVTRFQSISVPSSPARTVKRSPLFRHITPTSSPQASDADKDLKPQPEANLAPDSDSDDTLHMSPRQSPKSQPEVEPGSWTGLKKKMTRLSSKREVSKNAGRERESRRW